MNKSARIVNRQAWIQRLDRFKQADQTVAQFCQDEGVSVPSFYQWRQKLQPKPKPKSSVGTPAGVPAKFLPVQFPPVPAAQPATVLSLDLPGGIRLRLEVHCDQEHSS